MDFSVHGILQARILEWIAFPSPGDLPDPGIEPGSPTFQADALTSEPPGKPCSCPVFQAPLIEETVFSPLYILA